MSFSYSYKIIGLLLIGLWFMFGVGLADSVTTSGYLNRGISSWDRVTLCS